MSSFLPETGDFPGPPCPGNAAEAGMKGKLKQQEDPEQRALVSQPYPWADAELGPLAGTLRPVWDPGPEKSTGADWLHGPQRLPLPFHPNSP